MELTEGQYRYLQMLVDDPMVSALVARSWELYDQKRASGEWGKIETNPHVSTTMLAVVGYAFCIRGGLKEMQTDLKAVLEKLGNGTINNPWQT